MSAMKLITLSGLIAATTALASCASGYAPSSASGSTTYTGLVATRNAGANTFFGGETWITSRQYHVATENLLKGQWSLGYSNYYVNAGSELALPGSITYKSAVEYPAGVITPCTYGGNSTITITGLGQANSDHGSCDLAIPLGAGFWTRNLITGTLGIPVLPGTRNSVVVNSDTAVGDGGTYGTGTPTDLSYSGSFGSYYGGIIVPSAYIIGPTTRPSGCFAGDSRAFGVQDTPDTSGTRGEIERSLGPAFAWTNLSTGGEGLNSALTNYTQRLIVGQYCSFWVDEYGFTEIITGVPASQIESEHTSFAALVGKPTWSTTLPGYSTSTDNWATLANQIWAGSSGQLTQWQAYNSYQRSTGIAGEAGMFDVASIIATSGGLWFVNGSAYGYTPDGVHENTAGALLEQTSNLVNPAKICPSPLPCR